MWWVLFVCWNVALLYADARHRRVPNRLVVGAAVLQMLWAVAGLCLAQWRYPPLWPGWAMALAGFLMAGLFLPLWTRRLMAAGDIKAMAAYGLLLGAFKLLHVLVIASLLAGMHALVYVWASSFLALPPRLRQIPYVAYLAVGALSAAFMPLSLA